MSETQTLDQICLICAWVCMFQCVFVMLLLNQEVMGSRSWLCGRCLCSRRSFVFLPQQRLCSLQILLSL